MNPFKRYRLRFKQLLATSGLLVFLLFQSLPVSGFTFERRRDQFIDTPGYLILPVPYNYPGIGGGWALIGYAGNVFDSQLDTFLIGFTGDAEGYYLMLNELYLVDHFFYFNANQMNVSQYSVNMYSSRGMDTEKDDYSIFVGNKYQQSQVRGIMTLFDKRVECWAGWDEWKAKTSDIYDSQENLLLHYDNPAEFGQTATSYGFQLDLTDDRTDPRSGLRLKTSTQHFNAEHSGDPEYNVIFKGATLYIPLLDDSTWVFHYSRSDAVVLSEGNTDINSLAAEEDIADCAKYPSPYKEACEAAIYAKVQNTYNANKYGTSQSLGGAFSLRAYPNGRYSGAHTELMATEFRWNFTTKQSKINLYFLEDIIHALQIAVFYEEGSVSETEETLGDITRSSYGVGFRFVAESGNVYRADWATGEEGPQLTLLFQYPWGESD